MGYPLVAERRPAGSGRRRYQRPSNVLSMSLADMLDEIGRPNLEDDQLPFLGAGKGAPVDLFFSGNITVLKGPAIAVVGARDVSEAGAARARKLSRDLAAAGVTVVSGLAKGVDVNALRAAISVGGATAAVIGTPIAQAYPAEHGELQEEIAADHLLVSPFPDGQRVFPSNFPKRNRVMAALSDGSAIIEASDTSGTLHQAAECKRLGRWLFILQSVMDDQSLKWPKTFESYEKMRVIAKPDDVLDALAKG